MAMPKQKMSILPKIENQSSTILSSFGSLSNALCSDGNHFWIGDGKPTQQAVIKHQKRNFGSKELAFFQKLDVYVKNGLQIRNQRIQLYKKLALSFLYI